MPLYLKDKMVSGVSLGVPGKSAYEAAKEGGYAGTEEEFNQALTSVPGHITNTENPHSVTAAQVGADVAGAANEALNSAKAYTDQIVAGVIPGENSKESPTDSDSLFIYDNADSGKPKKTLISKLVELFNNTFYTKTETNTLLQNKASLATQQTVEKTNVTEKSVTLDISELQGYLDTLPRMLTETVAITVTGTTNASLNITGFYGSGYIDIRSTSLGNCTIKNLVTVSNCSVLVNLHRLLLETPGGNAVNTGLLTISDSPYVRVNLCGLSGGSGGPQDGLYISGGSMVSVEEVKISGFNTAIYVERCSVASVYNTTASDFQNNTTGGYVWRGGIILLAGNTPQTLGGSTNTKVGGMIVSKSGTLL